VRDGIPRPYLPRVPAPRPINPHRPRFDISLEAWGAEVAGTVAGHPDWPAEEADLGEDLDIDMAAGVTLDLGLIFPRGPRFNMAFTALQGEGEYAPYIMFPPGEEIVPSVMRLFLFDLTFTPMARGERWGTVSMEAGVRYARASIDIFGSQRFAEGTMLTLGGELELALQKQTLFGDVSASVGLGPDCAGLQFDVGVSLRASRVFHMRLGYRFLGLVLYDNIGVEDKERRFSAALGGPALEMGFTF
jgi:hypothetical protein